MYSHVYYMSGDAWKEGGIDATGEHLLIYCLQHTFISFRMMLIFRCIIYKLTKSQILSNTLSFHVHSYDVMQHVFTDVNILTPSWGLCHANCFLELHS